MLPPGTSTQLIGTTYLPSLPPKEISYICRHLQAYLQEPTVPRNQNNLKAARSSSKSQNRQVIWNSLQSCSAAHKLQNSTTRKVRILYIFCRMVRVRRAFCAAAVVVFYCVGQSPGRVSSAWEDVWLCMSAGAPWRQISWYLAMLLFSSRQLSLSAACDQRSHSFWSGLGFCARFSPVGQSSLCYPLFSIQGRWLWTRVILIIPMKPRVFSWSGLRDHYSGDWRENWPRLFLSPISIMSPTLHVYENSIHFSKSLLIIIYIQTILHYFISSNLWPICHLC